MCVCAVCVCVRVCVRVCVYVRVCGVCGCVRPDNVYRPHEEYPSGNGITNAYVRVQTARSVGTKGKGGETRVACANGQR